MHQFPLLDIKEALADADRNLDDVRYYVQVLLADTDGCYPPDAPLFLENVEALRAMLAEVIPSTLALAIAAEEAEYAAESDRWEPVNS